MDRSDHAIPPSDPQARISKSEFLDLIDAAFRRVLCQAGKGYLVVEGFRKAEIVAVAPFDAWFKEWLVAESGDCED